MPIGAHLTADVYLGRNKARTECERLCRTAGLKSSEGQVPGNRICWSAPDGASLHRVAAALAAASYYLVTMVVNDERDRDAPRPYCIRYIFSHPSADLFLSVGYTLPPAHEVYPSIRPHYAGVEPFEREASDLFGLRPQDQPLDREHGVRLHEGCYPSRLYPMRRDKTLREIRHDVLQHVRNGKVKMPSNGHHQPNVRDGEMLLPVGPIHAGVIEPGHFLFHLMGERVEKLDIKLGYTHKGTERFFQEFAWDDKLQDFVHIYEDSARVKGSTLAEFVATDSAFSHSLAYCQAVEELTSTSPPLAAKMTRALFLELERMANHIGDTGALAHDIAIDLIASDLGVLRERILELCRETAGHRLLLGVNKPGGIVMKEPLDKHKIGRAVNEIAHEYFGLGQALGEMRVFRRRAIGVGVLDPTTAHKLGVTGMIARASGLERDFRLHHPSPEDIYATPEFRDIIIRGSERVRSLGDTTGDVFARYADRMQQVDISVQLVRLLLERWDDAWKEREYGAEVTFPQPPQRRTSLGHVEGWRGDIVYWLMVDESSHIYRCKIRDPSVLNWPALEAAMTGTFLSDFPLTNKSFNLSYTGNDL